MSAATSARRFGLTLLGVLATLGLVSTAFAAAARPDFALAADPTSQSVQQGSTASYALTVSGSNGFTGSVGLSASGLPSGTTASFSPATVQLSTSTTRQSSTMTVTTAKSTPAGSYTVTVTGTSGSTKRSLALRLDVTLALAPDFTLAAAPTSVSVPAGSPALYSLAIGRPTNRTDPVTLAAHGSWPTGTSAAFVPNPATGTTAELRVTTATTTPTGTYTIWVVGSAAINGRTQYQYAQAQLTVTASTGAAEPFTISGGAPSALVPGGTAQPLDLELKNPNSSKALSVTNLTVTIGSVTQSSPAAGPCPVSDFAVKQYSGGYPLALGAGQTATLTQLGIPVSGLPTVQMLNTNVSQDGCKSASLALSYSGSAQGS